MVTMLYPSRPKTGDHAYFGYHTNGNHVIPPPLKNRWPCLLWLPFVIKKSKPNDNHDLPLSPKNRWPCLLWLRLKTGVHAYFVDKGPWKNRWQPKKRWPTLLCSPVVSFLTNIKKPIILEFKNGDHKKPTPPKKQVTMLTLLTKGPPRLGYCTKNGVLTLVTRGLIL